MAGWGSLLIVHAKCADLDQLRPPPGCGRFALAKLPFLLARLGLGRSLENSKPSGQSASQGASARLRLMLGEGLTFLIRSSVRHLAAASPTRRTDRDRRHHPTKL